LNKGTDLFQILKAFINQTDHDSFRKLLPVAQDSFQKNHAGSAYIITHGARKFCLLRKLTP